MFHATERKADEKENNEDTRGNLKLKPKKKTDGIGLDKIRIWENPSTN